MTAIPALPVTMYDENETIVVSTPAGYWQAIWEGFRVSGPVPPPARSEVPAHLSDLDTVEAKIPSAASLSATFARSVQPGSPAMPGRIVSSRGGAAVYGTSTMAAANTSRLRFPIRATGGDLRLVFCHATSGSGGDGDPSAAVTFKASIEKGGYIFPVTFRGGQLAVTVDQGIILSDPITFDVKAGDSLYVRTSVTAGTPRATAQSVAANGEGIAAGDLVAGGAVGAWTGTTSYVFGPSAILSTARNGSDNTAIGICGDSIAYGTGDTPADGAGFLVRAADAASLPWLLAARAQEKGASIVDLNYRYRGVLVSGVNKVYCEYGRNDLTNPGGSSLSLLQINILKVWTRLALRGPKVYQTTITPRTTSTDSWATTGNQAVADAPEEANRVAFNAWLRAGAPIDPTTKAAVAVGTMGVLMAGDIGHPLTAVVEVTDVVETARDSGVWKANYTADGLHPTPTAHAAMAAAVTMTA